jgi:hypothetical protein
MSILQIDVWALFISRLSILVASIVFMWSSHLFMKQTALQEQQN